MTDRKGVFLTGHRGASTLPRYMRSKAVHIVAAIAESLRFFAVVFLAFSVGALLDPSVSSLLRYAAAPQLLFAAGFFFMWLDPARYSPYRPLLIIGKAASAICFLPLAAALVGSEAAKGATFGLPRLGLELAFFLAAVDVMSLCVLVLGHPVSDGVRPASGEGRPGQAGSGAFPSGAPVGQSPEDIERVEGD
jgi:hypothetical protein